MPSVLSFSDKAPSSSLTRNRAYRVSSLLSCSLGVCGRRITSLLDEMSIMRVVDRQFVKGSLMYFTFPGRGASIE